MLMKNSIISVIVGVINSFQKNRGKKDFTQMYASL